MVVICARITSSLSRSLHFSCTCYYTWPVYSLKKICICHSCTFSLLKTMFYFKLRCLGGHVSFFFSFLCVPFILHTKHKHACFATLYRTSTMLGSLLTPRLIFRFQDLCVHVVQYLCSLCRLGMCVLSWLVLLKQLSSFRVTFLLIYCLYDWDLWSCGNVLDYTNRSFYYSFTQGCVGTPKSHLDALDLSEFCEHFSTKYCGVSKQFNSWSSFKEYVLQLPDDAGKLLA